MKKAVLPDEVYTVHILFACGEGHFMCPDFTHWEEGEACPYGHSPDSSEEDGCMYYRKLLIPVDASDGSDMWEYINAPENAGKWGQAPVAS